MASPQPPSSNTTPVTLPACAPAYLTQTRAWNPNALPDLKSATLKSALPKLLSHPNIAAKRRITSHASEPGPTVERGGDAGVVRARLDSVDRLIAIAAGGNARFSYLNPRRGALIAVVESLRRLACTGAVPFAISSRLSIADPAKPEEAYMLNEALGGLTEAVDHFGFPELGSGLSLTGANATGGDPVPTVTVVGQIEQEKYFTRQYVRSAGERLILLGAAPTELGGSQYLGIVHNLKTGDAPLCDLTAAHKLHLALVAMIKGGNIRGANSLTEGGLLCCVAEMLFTEGQTFGATLDLATLQGNRLDALLFGETQNRAIVVVSAERMGSVLADSHLRGVSAAVIGEVTAAPTLTVRGATEDAVTWSLEELRTAWDNSVAAKLTHAGLPA
jgi:phosphoribosylformylglycinamidine synthase subunit PurL